MTEIEFEELRKSVNDLAKLYTEGFKAIQKENPDLDVWAQIELTQGWWKGYIQMAMKQSEGK